MASKGMKVGHLNTNFYGTPSGSFSLSDGAGVIVTVTMTEEEVRTIETTLFGFFRNRQQEIAKGVADMEVPMIAAPEKPDVEDAEFEEVTEYTYSEGKSDDDDGMPF